MKRTDSQRKGTESANPASAEPRAASAAGRQLSLPVKMALLALRMYKVGVSPWLGGGCRFQPTCSVYMYQAIERFGVPRGVWLGLKRLARCQPFSRKFGHDPVPEKEVPDMTDHTHTPAAGPGGATPKEAHL
jgi:uncharacterized protein